MKIFRKSQKSRFLLVKHHENDQKQFQEVIIDHGDDIDIAVFTGGSTR